MIEDLIRKNRSCRRFYQNHPVKAQDMEELINMARMSPSAGNLQPLCYIISTNAKKNEEIFPCLGWAGYLKDWPGPEEGERPGAYIVVLLDTTISRDPGCDHGIACQSIMLAAREKKLGGCVIGSIDRKRLREVFQIQEKYQILLVLALGSPKETVVVERVPPDGSIRYWRDENGTHHVPKRALPDILLETCK